MRMHKAECLKVVDGDTFDVRRYWFRYKLPQSTCVIAFWQDIRVRLLDVNAYETRTKDKKEKKKGLAAKRFVKDFFKKSPEFFLKTSGKKDVFGRYLGYICTTTSKMDLGDLLIAQGLARRDVRD